MSMNVDAALQLAAILDRWLEAEAADDADPVGLAPEVAIAAQLFAARLRLDPPLGQPWRLAATSRRRALTVIAAPEQQVGLKRVQTRIEPGLEGASSLVERSGHRLMARANALLGLGLALVAIVGIAVSVPALGVWQGPHKVTAPTAEDGVSASSATASTWQTPEPSGSEVPAAARRTGRPTSGLPLRPSPVVRHSPPPSNVVQPSSTPDTPSHLERREAPPKPQLNPPNDEPPIDGTAAPAATATSGNETVAPSASPSRTRRPSATPGPPTQTPGPTVTIRPITPPGRPTTFLTPTSPPTATDPPSLSSPTPVPTATDIAAPPSATHSHDGLR